MQGNSRASGPPLQSIPVGSPFHTVGVYVLQLPLSYDGNKYAVVFMDYLTKWCEAFVVADQTAETIAKLLVEEVICRHSVLERLLFRSWNEFSIRVNSGTLSTNRNQKSTHLVIIRKWTD